MAKKGWNAVDIEANMSDGYKALGVVTGMSTTVSTDRFIESVVGYAHDNMARAFDREIDQVARSQADGLGHVYEWRMLGMPQGRLWHHTLSGRGTNKQASWSWVQSKAPILTPIERKQSGNPNDPINNVSDKDLERLSDRDYFFHWKAPMMEYGLKVNIVAKYAKALFVPSNTTKKGFYFAKATTNQLPNSNAGKFSAFWTAWWSGGAAAKEWDLNVRRTIEKDLGRTEKEMRKGRSRSKSFSLNAIASNDAAFEAGRNMAEAYIKGRAKSYKKATQYIDRYGKFGSEVNYPK